MNPSSTLQLRDAAPLPVTHLLPSLSNDNLSSPVSKLPNEILSIIFTLVRARCLATRKKKLRRPRTGSTTKWLVITIVCNRWRVVALNTPQLWSSLNLSLSDDALSQLDVVERDLKRSKGVPLQFECSLNSGDNQPGGRFWDVAQSVMREHDRIDRLSVVSERHDHLAKFVSLWSGQRSAQGLRYLRLSYHDEAGAGSTGDENGECAFPPDFLWASMPNLTYLTLMNVTAPRELPYLPTLRELRLLNRDPKVTVAWFLRAVASTPNVTYVHVDRLIRGDIHEDPTAVIIQCSRSSRIQLRYLQVLKVACDDLDQSEFLNHIELPVTTRFHLSFDRLPMGAAAAYLSLLQNACHRFSFNGSSDSTLTRNRPFNEIQVLCSEKWLQFHFLVPENLRNLSVDREGSLSISLPLPDQRRLQAYENFCKGLRMLTAVEILRFHHCGHHYIDVGFWASFIRRFTRLAVLTVDNCDMTLAKHVLMSLTSRVKSGEESSENGVVPIASITMLRFYGCHYDRSSAYDWLPAFVRARKSLGVPLKRVDFESCSIVSGLLGVGTTSEGRE
ncbi:hypothetical protein ONZ45_g9435 [Pleurotus djamor]|nr:hypothetical protein ONZ45_g9435 [Pleurotus djamor]